MKKTLIAVAIVVVFAAYAIYQHNQNINKTNTLALNTTVNQTPVSDTPPITPTPTPVATPTTPVTTPTPKPVPTPVPAPTGQFKDGQCTGDVADAFYGKIQVKAVITNGKLADVQFLQYPTDRGESAQISARMMPILTSEAIKAQSANVDIVSGATQDSEAFTQSLQSALNQAKS